MSDALDQILSNENHKLSEKGVKKVSTLSRSLAWSAPQVDGHRGRDEGCKCGGRGAPNGDDQRPLSRLWQWKWKSQRLAQRRLRLLEEQKTQEEAGCGAASVCGPPYAGTRVAQQEVVVQRKGYVRHAKGAHRQGSHHAIPQGCEILQKLRVLVSRARNILPAYLKFMY
jgi:hypothetical protein